ncbi:MAG: bifunctional acyl-ACP--phospholipid O-acyltransferase/long-chain-fatty-acid--ACP ligase [Bryobacteraceae bacterium]|nr:bifunctional acyl-ACP--phospholipid O-acyltransferase/long-chain-fatty-acid--ACP ligase [Bryobacteraceae bacterium]
MPRWTKAARVVVRLVLRTLYRVEVTGSVPQASRLLFVSNHQSFIDPLLLGAFLPVIPVWLVHTTIAAKWHFRLILRLFPHLVVDTMSPWSIKAVIGLLEAGQPVAIFPEGRITVTGSMMKIYEGPAFAAARAGATVVPVHIAGAVYSHFSRMRGDFPKRFFPRINLTILPATTIAMPQARTSKLRRKAAGEKLRRILQEAAFEARHPATLFSALLDAVSLHGRGRKMLQDITLQERSYSGILKGALALGRIVSRLAGEREAVGVLMPNAGATVMLLLGMFGMRRVPALLNYTAGAGGIQQACEMAHVRVIVTSRTFLEKARLQEIAQKLQRVQVVYLEDLRKAFGMLDKLWLMAWALWFPQAATQKMRPEEPAVILFTSGSEARPKGVVLSHASILANIEQIKSIIEFAPPDKFMAALPLFHAFGLTAGMLLPLLNGSPVFIYPSPLHYRRIPETVYEYDCTVLFGTNTFLANYAKVAHPYDFARMRYVVGGAEKLTAEVRQIYMEKFGVRVLEGYGATECSPVLAVNTPLAYRTGSVGELLPGIEARLESVEGIEEGGILHVRGPNVMLGYLKEGHPDGIEPPSSIFGPGWYNTGDIVSIDPDGLVHIIGRVKRFAKVAGEMVSLEMVERIAGAASPGVQHAAVAVPGTTRGETVVLLTEDANLKREQLQETARQLGASDLALPRHILYAERLPLLASGKRDYPAISRMAKDRTAMAGRGL